MRSRTPAIPVYGTEEKKLREDARFIAAGWTGYFSYSRLAVEAYRRAHLYSDTIGYDDALGILCSEDARIGYALSLYTEEYVKIMYHRWWSGERAMCIPD